MRRLIILGKLHKQFVYKIDEKKSFSKFFSSFSNRSREEEKKTEGRFVITEAEIE